MPDKRYRNTFQEIYDKDMFMPEPNSGCWLWIRALNTHGYGKVKLGKRIAGAHLIFYENLVGQVPEGMELDHKCRVRCCVNPAHLEPVTHAENARRGARAKLTRAMAEEIRAIPREVALKVGGAAIGQRYGVKANTISRIRTGARWAPDKIGC